MTHSHDTATPALSVESEYVLVPREPTPEMMLAGYGNRFRLDTTLGRQAARGLYASMIAAAPAPNPSPAAKGGEAVVVQSLRWARTTDPSEGSVHYGTGVFGHRYAASRAKHKAWSVNHHVDGKNVIVGLFENLADAYTAAQADYTRHICSALATPSPQPAHSDDLAVDRFAVAMKAKLADARAKGKGGWNDETECSRQYLSDELRRHALKPDPLDVANFAMFLHQRNEEIALPSPQPADAVREAEENADQWRTLALQFDAHRIQALSHLKGMVADAETHKAGAESFLEAAPLSGETVLAERLAALASDPAPAGEAVEPVAPWGDCKIAYGIKDAHAVWAADKSGELQLPAGWTLDETNGEGARYVAIFRVIGIPHAKDGQAVAERLVSIAARSASREGASDE